ncbi:MAG: prepilin-type N-terminal cleavage/methylation domain-containing protein [Candidatus Omnitrophica bacterium]|nr:prepilin-type N-terminal cleavage/methylation domain-containing protein [Candidatus Omnitrophota bacterium]
MRRIPEKDRLFKDHRGATLVEMMVTVIIFAFILGICYSLLISGSDSWETNSARVELQQELRKAMDWITQDLRQAGSASIVDVPADGATYTSITFRKSAGVSGGNLVWDASTTRYLLGGTGGTQLLRQVGSQAASVIAQNIQSVQFSRQAGTANVASVSLQTQKTALRRKMLTGTAPSLTLKIYLRN